VKPFPLGNTLRDLALLRGSEVDVGALAPQATPTTSINASHATNDSRFGAAVEESYDFVREARMALKIQNRGGVVSQGERVEEVRNKLEELLTGLDTK